MRGGWVCFAGRGVVLRNTRSPRRPIRWAHWGESNRTGGTTSRQRHSFEKGAGHRTGSGAADAPGDRPEALMNPSTLPFPPQTCLGGLGKASTSCC